jgi:hypothetical protein
MANPIHSEHSSVTLNDVSDACMDMIDVFEEAYMLLPSSQIIGELKSMNKEGNFTYSSLASSMISLFEVWEETSNFLIHFVKLGEKNTHAAWYTAHEVNLALEHLLESQD